MNVRKELIAECAISKARLIPLIRLQKQYGKDYQRAEANQLKSIGYKFDKPLWYGFYDEVDKDGIGNYTKHQNTKFSDFAPLYPKELRNIPYVPSERYRAIHIVQCLLRGKTMQQIEQKVKCHPDDPRQQNKVRPGWLTQALDAEIDDLYEKSDKGYDFRKQFTLDIKVPEGYYRDSGIHLDVTVIECVPVA